MFHDYSHIKHFLFISTVGPRSAGSTVGPGSTGSTVGPGSTGGTVGPGSTGSTVGSGSTGGSYLVGVEVKEHRLCPGLLGLLPPISRM